MGFDSVTASAADPLRALRQCWRTPPEFFNGLHDIFDFTVDACASPDNALLPRYWTAEDDCLKQDWAGERAFVNPPFGNIAPIMDKAATARLCVFLLPITALATRYIDRAPVRFLGLPPTRLRLIPPAGLTVNTPSPSLATVVVVLGNATDQQGEKLRALGLRVMVNLA